MSGFEKYWEDYVSSDVVLGPEEYCAEQAWDHQQAKIDELNKRLESIKQLASEWKDRTSSTSLGLSDRLHAFNFGCELEERLKNYDAT